MTETPQQDRQARPGAAFENLRSYERLRRSVTDRKVAGVAGGLGRHLNIDPNVLRVIFVVLVFFGGAGLVLYGAAWLLVPEEGSDQGLVESTPGTRNALLIAAGVLAALLLVGDAWGGFGFPWPLLVVGVVLLVVMLNRDRGGRTAPPPGPPAGHPTGTTEAGSPPIDTEEGAEMNDPTTTLDHEPPGGPPPGYYDWQATPQGPQPQPRPDRGPRLFGPTVALVLLALGTLGLYDIGFSVVDAAYPALALTVIGVMLLVGSVLGRPGGLVALGIVAALALAVTGAADGNWDADRLARTPTSAAAVADGYDLGAGQIRLDLTEVEDLENLDGRTVTLDAAAGELLVWVPEGLDVDVHADIDVGGEIEVDGTIRNGNSVELTRFIDGGDDAPQLSLELDLVVGHIEVRQEEAA